jgi:hypothetical protein
MSFGTEHVALVLACWGPIIIFGTTALLLHRNLADLSSTITFTRNMEIRSILGGKRDV